MTMPKEGFMSRSEVRSICFECHSRCGVVLGVEDGKVVSVQGDKEHPFSQGFLCPKGRACMEIIYHPERITTPLKREGSKEDGTFIPISWDEALDVIATRLLAAKDAWGPESFALGTGTTRGIPPFLNRFLTAYGSPNYFGVVYMSGGPILFGGLTTVGFPMSPEFHASKCIVLWASNPDQSNPGLYNHAIKQSLQNGGKLIVVDPRETALAKKADHWLQLRPGTDVAMALCFMNVIINNDLYDKTFVDQWTVGFEKLREHVAPYTPRYTAGITWVAAEAIEAAAMDFARTRPGCIHPGQAGACQAPNAFDLNRALSILAALTGNLEVPGGNVNFVPPTGPERSCYGSDFDVLRNLPPEKAQKRLGMEKYPLESTWMANPEFVWDAILDGKPYPVKAVGLFASNPMCAYPDSGRVRQALSNVDFMFAIDYFHTPTTALADIILPPAHWTERDDVEDALMMNHVFCQRKAVDPPGQCRDEKQILVELAERMRLKGYWQSVREGLDYRLEPLGMSFADFKKVGMVNTPVVYKSYEKTNGFATLSGSGKVDLYSEYLSVSGHSPLPVYAEPPESPVSTPKLYAQYPLILTTGGRNVVYFHSAHRNISSLRKLSPDPRLDIHPDTAAELAIEEGEWVWLVSPRSRVEIRVRLNAGMDPRVVHAPHGYWYGVEQGWRRLNINQITSNSPQCPFSGAVPTRALLCKVEKMATAPGTV